MTFPLILIPVAVLSLTRLPTMVTPVVVLYLCVSFCTAYALLNTGCVDPGLLERTTEAPPTEYDGRRWMFNDQADSYKPPGAIYSNDCRAIVEDFDHVCPWTGTAIGGGNLFCFYTFVLLLAAYLVFSGIITMHPEDFEK